MNLSNRFFTFLKKIIFNEKIILIIFLFYLLILFLYLFKVPFVRIDNTAILLMILVLITPFASHIKKIKWGDFEAEISLSQDIEKLGQQVKETVKVEKEPEISTKTNALSKELYELASKDVILALAKVRIEIERRLKKLFVYGKEMNVSGLRTMTQTLTATGVIDNKLRNIILDLASILNRATHGEELPTEAKIDNILEIGISIIDELDHIYYDKLVDPISKKIITKKKLSDYMEAKYEVTSVVPLVEKPYINKRILNQEQLDQLLEGHDEYAEFLVDIKKIE